MTRLFDWVEASLLVAFGLVILFAVLTAAFLSSGALFMGAFSAWCCGVNSRRFAEKMKKKPHANV